jgi:hypothetical protein
MSSDTEIRSPHQGGLPRFGRIEHGILRSGLSRAALYILASEHPGLFKKYGAATIVDLDKLDQIIASLPDAEIAPRKSEVA